MLNLLCYINSFYKYKILQTNIRRANIYATISAFYTANKTISININDSRDSNIDNSHCQ